MRVSEYGQIMYQLKQVGQQVAQYFEEEQGISLVRYRLVTFLAQEPANQQMISQHLGIDQAAVTRHLKRLEEDGWVVRQRDPGNQRQIVVTVTQKAEQAIAACEAKGTDALAQSLLPVEDMGLLQGLLNQLSHQLQQLTTHNHH